MEFSINLMAVLIAAIAQMVIGFLWYGPLFGKMWQKLSVSVFGSYGSIARTV